MVERCAKCRGLWVALKHRGDLLCQSCWQAICEAEERKEQVAYLDRLERNPLAIAVTADRLLEEIHHA